MDSQNTLLINGSIYPFEAGETILEVARRNGIYIPTLCHLEGTKNTGACRVCLVEVKGARGLVASCAMPAGKDMEVRTDTPKVTEERRFVIALLMISGNHNCAARGDGASDWTDFQLDTREYDHSTELCDAYGACELQALAYRYQVHELIDEMRLHNLEQKYPFEDANDFILRDFSRCILCGRCVKACNEIQVNNAISFGYRGVEAKIVTRGDVSLAESDCVFCGECIQRCPVGALVEKNNRYSTRIWDLERTKSTCGHCGTGCSVDLFTRDGVLVRTSGNNAGPANHGSLCNRGRYGNDFISHADRLTQPLVRKDNTLVETTWDAALDQVALSLAEVKKAHGPGSIAGILSANATNEDAFAMRRYFTEVLGSPNLDNSARLTDADALEALRPMLGAAAATGSLSDLNTADLVFLVGADATISHPVIGSAVKRAARREGAALIVIDPGEPDITRHARHHLRPKAGTELAVLGGLLKVILDEKLYDKKVTLGDLPALVTSVQSWTPSHVQEISGVPADQLVDVARAYAAASDAATVFGAGVNRSATAPELVKALADLAILCGGGLLPLREQCNTQGVMDLGCTPGPDGVHADGLAKAIVDGQVKALLVCGEDPAVTVPGLATGGVLDKLDLLVVHDIFPGETSRKADVVLPALSFLETEGTFTNTERRVQRVRKALEGPGDARSSWSMFSALAASAEANFGYGTASEVFDSLAAATPTYAEMSHARLDEVGGIQWTFPATETGAEGLTALAPPRPPLPQSPDYSYVLTLTDGVRRPTHHSAVSGSSKGPQVEINPEDAAKLGLQDGNKVRILSRIGLATEAAVILSDRPPQGALLAALLPHSPALARLFGRSAPGSSVGAARMTCAVKLQKQ